MEKLKTSEDWENDFFNAEGYSYCIYQLKRVDDNAYHRFMGYDWLKENGYEVEYNRYEAVYSGSLTEFGEQSDVNTLLEAIYYRFNEQRPADYKAPSLSVSDVVAIKTPACIITCYYTNNIGFKKVYEFRNELMHAWAVWARKVSLQSEAQS